VRTCKARPCCCRAGLVRHAAMELAVVRFVVVVVLAATTAQSVARSVFAPIAAALDVRDADVLFSLG